MMITKTIDPVTIPATSPPDFFSVSAGAILIM